MYRTETGCSHFLNPDQTPDFTVTSKPLNPSEPSLISWGYKNFKQVIWNDRHMFILSLFRRTAVLDQGSPGSVPSLSPGKNLASPPASGDCFAVHHSIPCLGLHSVLSLCVSVCIPLLIRIIFTELVPAQLLWPPLKAITFVNSLFSNMVTFTGSQG